MKLIILIMLHLLKPEPNHPLNKDPKALEEMAGYFLEAGKEFDLDPVLLTVKSFDESSFRPEVIGALNEKGLLQVHGRINKNDCMRRGIGLSTAQEQIKCGALILAREKRNCGGTIEKALWAYASGKCEGTPRAKRSTAYTLGRVKRLKKKYADR